MTKKLILDSSPLIVLLKSDLENILPELFDEIIVPEAVWQEVLAGKENDIAKRKLPHLGWAKRVTKTNLSEKIEKYNLGKGEKAVLNLALTSSNSRVLLDDYAARKCAKALNLQVIGTGGLLILAKQNNLIFSVSEGIEKIQRSGLWISEEIIKLIKEKVGE